MHNVIMVLIAVFVITTTLYLVIKEAVKQAIIEAHRMMEKEARESKENKLE